jgi:predicted negative regulator of RcsB-dependent stress response
VDDYLTEAEQWERFKKWLTDYTPWILGGIALAVAGLLAWNWYWDRQDNIALQASARYQELTEALARNDTTKAKAISAGLEREFPGSPYVDQAHMFDARMAVEANDLAKAGQLLRGVMERTKDEQLALVARVRLGRVLVAQNKPDEALALLDTKLAGAFAARFHEVRGDALFAKGDRAGALKEYEQAREGAGNGSVDNESLTLKINDLKTETPAAAAVEKPADTEKAAEKPAEKATGAQ